jgi:DNA-directed RNA polymerase subunit K/omega
MEKSTFLAEDFREKGENIYEVILIVAKRARQIGELQKRMIDRALGQTEMMEQQAEQELEGEEMERIFEPDDRPQLNLEKPAIKAMREMANDEVDWKRDE